MYVFILATIFVLYDAPNFSYYVEELLSDATLRKSATTSQAPQKVRRLGIVVAQRGLEPLD